MEEHDLTVCCIKMCYKPSIALGLCVNHWRRNKKWGSPVALKTHSGQFRGMRAEERFERQVIKVEGGCWGWRGSLDNGGYAKVRYDLRGIPYTKGHRFSYALYTGHDPGPFMVCHRCDNPKCTNPDHLFLGTARDNMKDKIAKGRARIPKGDESTSAKITEAQAAAILIDARPYAVIAAEYGVASATIGDIKNRKSWRHLDIAPIKAKRISPRRGVSDKLNPDIVREIRSSPERGRDIALRFGLTQQTVCDIRKRRSWAHVTD